MQKIKSKGPRAIKAQAKRLGQNFKLKFALNETMSIDRMVHLIKLGNTCERALNQWHFEQGKGQGVSQENFIEGAARYLKNCPWYKDQREIRRAMIVGHRTFCCPISGTILDLDHSFIIQVNVKEGLANVIISDKGLDELYRKDAKTTLKIIAT